MATNDSAEHPPTPPSGDLPQPVANSTGESGENPDRHAAEMVEEDLGKLTPWQKMVLWRAITGLAIAVMVVLAVAAVFILKKALGFLQPVLVPLAVAGVLAFLLDPLIGKLHRWGMNRGAAMGVVLGGFFLAIGGLFGTVIPIAVIQGQSFAEDWPETVDRVRSFFNEEMLPVANAFGVDIGQDAVEESVEPDHKPEPDSETQETSQEVAVQAAKAEILEQRILHQNTPFDHLVARLFSTENQASAIGWLRERMTGFLGVLGYLVGFLLVPVYLFFFLKERTWIKRHWRDLLPLREGRVRDEIADVLQEINGYLIAFFRGQVVVSFIDGLLTALLLHFIGLPYAWIIGFALAIIGIIPFVGIIVTMIPAVLVAFASAGDHSWDWVQAHPWGYALLVVGIFFAVQQFDGLVIQPKIVGDATGLHPMTVIFSVVFWSFLLGGILGAILAVPMTAAVKVLLRRYIWEGNWASRIRGREEREENPPGGDNADPLPT